MRYAFVAEHRALFSVRAMCRCLRIQPSGFYAWVKNPKGTPCAKYKVPSSVRVPAVKEAGRNAFLMPAMVSEHHERRPSLIA